MIPGMPALGIRFDIDKLESGAYGVAAWRIFWRAVDVEGLAGGTLLFEGDSAATLNGDENVFCIAVQSMDEGLLRQIRSTLEASDEFQSMASLPGFIEDVRVTVEPLPEAGRVDAAGDLVGDQACNSRSALGSVKRGNNTSPPPAPEIRPVLDLKKPASQRTADLPTLSSLEEFKSFLEKNFAESGQTFWWYVTPEELCDIVRG